MKKLTDTELAALDQDGLRAHIRTLEKRLEAEYDHPYDGIECRDETIKLQDENVDRLRAKIENLLDVIQSYENDNGRSYDPSRIF